MKKLFLQAGIAFMPFAFSFAQTWTAQTPGTTTDLWGVDFVDPVNG